MNVVLVSGKAKWQHELKKKKKEKKGKRDLIGKENLKFESTRMEAEAHQGA